MKGITGNPRRDFWPRKTSSFYRAKHVSPITHTSSTVTRPQGRGPDHTFYHTKFARHLVSVWVSYLASYKGNENRGVYHRNENLGWTQKKFSGNKVIKTKSPHSGIVYTHAYYSYQGLRLISALWNDQEIRIPGIRWISYDNITLQWVGVK